MRVKKNKLKQRIKKGGNMTDPKTIFSILSKLLPKTNEYFWQVLEKADEPFIERLVRTIEETKVFVLTHSSGIGPRKLMQRILENTILEIDDFVKQEVENRDYTPFNHGKMEFNLLERGEHDGEGIWPLINRMKCELFEPATIRDLLYFFEEFRFVTDRFQIISPIAMKQGDFPVFPKIFANKLSVEIAGGIINKEGLYKSKKLPSEEGPIKSYFLGVRRGG